MNITNYRDINYLVWSNPYVIKYNKVIKELKQKFQVKKSYEKVLAQLKNLKWVKTEIETNFETKITNNFDNIDNILNNKLKSLQNKINQVQRQIKLNLDNKQKILDREYMNNCPICYENDIENYTITSCGHFFCTSCFRKCISRHTKCPICRTILFTDDMAFFNTTEYSFPLINKYKQNQIVDLPINHNENIIYLPPNSTGLIRNFNPKSLIISYKNIYNNEEILSYDNFITQERFKHMISDIENNMKESFDKKLSTIINLFLQVMKSRIGRENTMSEIVVPNSMDDN